MRRFLQRDQTYRVPVSGLWSQGLTPRLFNLDVTLRGCQFTGFDGRYSGTYLNIPETLSEIRRDCASDTSQIRPVVRIAIRRVTVFAWDSSGGELAESTNFNSVGCAHKNSRTFMADFKLGNLAQPFGQRCLEFIEHSEPADLAAG
jgi:hypothetical protein